MTRILAAALAVAILAVPLTPRPASAHARHDGIHPRQYDGTWPPEAYPNCFAWDPKLRSRVWMCGSPYPPGYPAQR
jgi:hypothetical protein